MDPVPLLQALVRIDSTSNRPNGHVLDLLEAQLRPHGFELRRSRWTDAEGVPTYYLLQDPAGGPIDPALFPFIADPVELRGEQAEWGHLNILRVRPEDVRRL